ncbi:hypothetical protein BASA81_000142 [Batrachochytrium salamandrivorans]|nr:hypothetical protein BASA81_000142 [Batrachochytrium salamandrivorans]
MSAAASTTTRALYRNLLKEAKQFPDYEMRPYIARRTKDDFRVKFRALQGEQLDQQVQFGQSQLALIRRQAAIRNLYIAPKSVVELSAAKASNKQ